MMTNKCYKPVYFNNTSNISLFSILQWNIRGFNSTEYSTQQHKEEAIVAINFDIQPDIICIQEGRVHYEWRQQQTTTKIPEPAFLSNYFCCGASNSFYQIIFFFFFKR